MEEGELGEEAGEGREAAMGVTRDGVYVGNSEDNGLLRREYGSKSRGELWDTGKAIDTEAFCEGWEEDSKPSRDCRISGVRSCEKWGVRWWDE